MPDLSTYLRQSSLTYSDVVRDLTVYVNSLPDGSKPKDLFLGSEGKLIIDYLAAEHSDIAYKIIMGFCENYLLYANKTENIIANAESKGYNVPRGRNPILRITYVSNNANPIQYLDQVGTVEDYGLYALNKITEVEVGAQITLDVVIGERKIMNYTVTDPEQLVYRFTNPKVSDDLRVYVGESDLAVDHTTDPVQALYGKLCVMTNSYGSIDLLDFSSLEAAQDYVINKDYQIDAQTVLKVEYIELTSIKYEGAIGTFSLGTISSVVQTSVGSTSATPVEVQKNAMLYMQTHNRVVARRDYKKVTQLHVPGILNVNDIDFSPATVAVTYVMKSGLPMNEAEYAELITYLNQSRAAGIPLPYILNSNAVTLTLNASISLSSYVESETLTQKIEAEYANYSYQPGIMLDFNELEENCEHINNVQVVRYSFNPVDYPAGAYCPLGTVIQPGDDNAYVASAYAYSTGDAEPIWPIYPGGTILDGSITWKCVPFEDAPMWEPNTVLNQGQVRLPSVANGFAYEVVAAEYFTGSIEPTNEGYDADILWKLLPYDSTAENWMPNVALPYGAVRNFTTIEGYSMVVAGFRKKAPNIEPEWNTENQHTIVGDILFMRVPLSGGVIAKGAELQMPWNSYLVLDCKIN